MKLIWYVSKGEDRPLPTKHDDKLCLFLCAKLLFKNNKHQPTVNQLYEQFLLIRDYKRGGLYHMA